MGFQGKLKDLSLPDILQVVQITRKSGVLRIFDDANHARIVIRDGEVVDAHPPGAGTLTEDLESRGLISSEARETRPGAGELIGEALVQRGLIGREQLESVVRSRVETTFNMTIGWDRGQFEFEIDESEGAAESGIAMEVLRGLSFNTQQLLMDALRELDERRADGGTVAAAESEPPPAGQPRSPEPRLLVVGPESFRDGIRLAVSGLSAELTDHEDLEAAARVVAMDPARAVLVVTHVGAEAGDLTEAISRIVVLARRTAVVTASEDPALAAGALHSGSAAHVVLNPRDRGPALAYLQSLVAVQIEELRAPGAPRRTPLPQNPLERFSSEIERLRDRVTTLATGVHTSSVTMKLLEFIAERFDRGLLFLVRAGDLRGLGAFGESAAGDPIGQMASGLTLPLDEDSAFHRAIETRTSMVWEIESNCAAERMLLDAIGTPSPSRALLLPIAGLAGAVAFIYADNGSTGRALEPEYPDLDVLARQAGVVLENSSLRRMLQKKDEPPLL